MNNSTYYHVEHKTLKVIEALMKGHIVTLDGEQYRYLRRGQEFEDLEATETGFFTSGNYSDGNVCWMFVTGDLGFVESKVKKASWEEVDAIIANLSLSSMNKEKSIERHVLMVKNKLMKDQGRKFLIRAFNTKEFDRTESVILNRLYDYLQKDNTFPLDRVEFYSINSKMVDECVEMLFKTLKTLTSEGVIFQKSVFGDACPHAKLADGYMLSTCA